MNEKAKTKKELADEISQLKAINSQLTNINEKLINDLLIGNINHLSGNKIELVKELIENIPSVCFAFTQNGEILSWNNSATDLYGFSKTEIIGKNAIDFLVPPGEKEKIKKIINEVFEGKTFNATDWKDCDKNGSLVHHKGKVFPVFKDDGSVAFGLNIDIDLPISEINTSKKEQDKVETKDQKLLNYWQSLIEKIETRTDKLLKDNKALENRYKLIAENVNDVIWIFDITEKKMVYISPSVFNLRGYTAEEAILQSFKESLSPNSYVKVEKLMDENIPKILAGEKEHGKATIELQQKCKDGTYKWVEISTTYFENPDSKNMCLLGITRDIDEKKKTIEALKQSETKYRQLIEGFTDEYVFYSHTPEGIFDYVSPTALKIFGILPEKMINKHYNEVLETTPESKEIAKEVDKQNLSGETSPPHNLSFIHPDGTKRTIKISERPVFNKEGKVVLVEGIAHDITNWKKAEAALKESEVKFRAVSELSPVAISILKMDKFLYVNPAWSKLTGYTIKESKKLVPLDVVHPDMKEMVKKRATARLDGEIVPSRYEMKGIKKTGETVWWDFTAIPIDYEGENAILAMNLDITKNKKVEQEIKDSEEKFRALAELSPVGITFNRFDHYLYVNEAYTKMTGFTKEDVKTLDPLLTVHPDMREIIRKRLSDRLKGLDVPNRYEFKGLKKDGSTIWLDMSATSFMYQGQPTVVAAMLDITQNKKAAETLRKSEEKFRSLFENSGDAIIISKDRVVQDLNLAAERIFGYDKYELIGKSTRLFHVSNESHTDYGAIIYPQVYLNNISRLEWVFKNKSGEEIVMDTTSTELHGGSVISIFRDVTERKRTEIALRESEARFRAVFESSPMGIHLYELKGKNDLIFIDANPAADKHTGINNKELIGKKLEEAFPSLAATEVPQRYLEAALYGKDWHTVQFSYKDNKISGAFDIYIFQISPKKMAVLFLDITEPKKAEEQLKQSEINYRKLTEQLMEANNIKDLLLDVITHDLRNPATVIYNSASLFEDEIPDPELLDIIKASSKKLFKVMENAKILAQVTSDEEIELKEFDLCESIKESIDEYSSILKRHSIDVCFSPKHSFPVMANEIISQVFKNYISNVIKYATNGKKIDIQISNIEENVIVKFIDFGETIPEEQREMIFKRGFQLTGDEKTGRGLGLSIVKRIAEVHKGKVWVEPNIPKGNKFCLSLPKL